MKIQIQFIAIMTVFVSVWIMTSSAMACGDDGSCQQSFCGESDNHCQCADPNCGSNSCLNKSDCCQAFGNIGTDHLPQD